MALPTTKHAAETGICDVDQQPTNFVVADQRFVRGSSMQRDFPEAWNGLDTQDKQAVVVIPSDNLWPSGVNTWQVLQLNNIANLSGDGFFIGRKYMMMTLECRMNASVGTVFPVNYSLPLRWAIVYDMQPDSGLISATDVWVTDNVYAIPAAAAVDRLIILKDVTVYLGAVSNGGGYFWHGVVDIGLPTVATSGITQFTGKLYLMTCGNFVDINLNGDCYFRLVYNDN